LRESPAVIGDDTVLIDEMPGNAVEDMGIIPSARDEKQKRAFAAHLIGKSRSRHAQCVRFYAIHQKSPFFSIQ